MRPKFSLKNETEELLFLFFSWLTMSCFLPGFPSEVSDRIKYNSLLCWNFPCYRWTFFWYNGLWTSSQKMVHAIGCDSVIVLLSTKLGFKIIYGTVYGKTVFDWGRLKYSSGMIQYNKTRNLLNKFKSLSHAVITLLITKDYNGQTD